MGSERDSLKHKGPKGEKRSSSVILIIRQSPDLSDTRSYKYESCFCFLKSVGTGKVHKTALLDWYPFVHEAYNRIYYNI